MGGKPPKPEWIKKEGDFKREEAIRMASELRRFQSGATRSTLLAKPTNLSAGQPLVGSGPIQQ